MSVLILSICSSAEVVLDLEVLVEEMIIFDARKDEGTAMSETYVARAMGTYKEQYVVLLMKIDSCLLNFNTISVDIRSSSFSTYFFKKNLQMFSDAVIESTSCQISVL